MGTAADGSINNSETIYFPEATEAWGTVSHIALYSSQTGGNLMGYAHIIDDQGADTTLSIAEKTVPLIRAGKFVLSFVDAV